MGFRVPPGAFQPPPKVTSAVVSLRPHSADRLPPVERRALDGITRAAFSHRRKTIANSLRYAGVVAGAPEPLLEAAGIAPSRRAEEVSLEEFERLALVYASSLTQS